MSYPDRRYTGDSGEVTASYRPADRTADLTYANGTRVHYLATGGSTSGRFGLYRWEMTADAGGAEPHFHRSIAESFYVLSGEVRLFDGRTWVDGRPGDFVHVPEGGIHAFRNESGAAASMLIHFAPGAPREDYFEGLPLLAQMSDDERTEFFVRHDNHWV